MERIDYYINMKDGVKPSAESLQKFIANGKGNYNLKECNKQTNNNLAFRHYSSLKDKPTIQQIEWVERINKACRENGLKEIVIKGDLHRGQIHRQMNQKFRELKALGIQVNNERKIHCSDCKYFSQNIGKCGTCSYTRCTCRADWGCSNAELRKKKVSNG